MPSPMLYKTILAMRCLQFDSSRALPYCNAQNAMPHKAIPMPSIRYPTSNTLQRNAHRPMTHKATPYNAMPPIRCSTSNTSPCNAHFGFPLALHIRFGQSLCGSPSRNRQIFLSDSIKFSEILCPLSSPALEDS